MTDTTERRTVAVSRNPRDRYDNETDGRSTRAAVGHVRRPTAQTSADRTAFEASLPEENLCGFKASRGPSARPTDVGRRRAVPRVSRTVINTSDKSNS